MRQLHFEEAAELAYFGAKILHPTCIQPAKYANIPVRLLNTMDPEAPGTLISNDTEKGKIKVTYNADDTHLFINGYSSVFLQVIQNLVKMLLVIDCYRYTYLCSTDHVDRRLIAFEDFEYLTQETVSQ